MRLINQRTKGLMEDCKKKARDFGLQFDDTTLEYVVSNKDMVYLTPKVFVPSHYDFWMQDVNIWYGKGEYELYPHNPFETVVNTRPSISFYNNDNPDWLNVMIFYHVLAHQDFFQNNILYSHTWRDDLYGRALSGKRRLNEIRKEQGSDKHWVDYVVEFVRQIDNLVNTFKKTREEENFNQRNSLTDIDFFFGEFLKNQDLTSHEYLREVNSYNSLVKEYGEEGAKEKFRSDIKMRYPEFQYYYNEFKNRKLEREDDIIDFITNNSSIMSKPGNEWMYEVVEIVKEMAEYLEPQRRTSIANEGWATYIHNELFLQDDFLKTHESDFAYINSKVAAIPHVGLNPYALGYRLYSFIRDLADKGKLNYDFQRILDINKRDSFNAKTDTGKDSILEARRLCDDTMLLNFLDKNNFQDFVSYYKLNVVGRRLNLERETWEYYIKSKNGEDYRQMVLDKLPHPPFIEYYMDGKGKLILNHIDEGKQLKKEFVPNVLRGLQFLFGNIVKLYTTEYELKSERDYLRWLSGEEIDTYKKRVCYTTKFSGSIDKEIVDHR